MRGSTSLVVPRRGRVRSGQVSRGQVVSWCSRALLSPRITADRSDVNPAPAKLSLSQCRGGIAVKEPWPSEAAGPAAVFRSIYEKPITGVAHGPEVYAHLRNARSPIDNRPPARMDRGHALDGAPGARGSPKLPTLSPAPPRQQKIWKASPRS